MARKDRWSESLVYPGWYWVRLVDRKTKEVVGCRYEPTQFPEGEGGEPAVHFFDVEQMLDDYNEGKRWQFLGPLDPPKDAHPVPS